MIKKCIQLSLLCFAVTVTPVAAEEGFGSPSLDSEALGQVRGMQVQKPKAGNKPALGYVLPQLPEQQGTHSVGSSTAETAKEIMHPIVPGIFGGPRHRSVRSY